MYDTKSERQVLTDLGTLQRRSMSSLGVEFGSPNVSNRTLWALSRRILQTLPSFKEMIGNEDLQVRTVILSAKGRPTQSMPFARFDYASILNETWERSEFHRQLTSRFIFMRYRTMTDDTIVFDGAKFWSMPEADVAEAGHVWEVTVSRIVANQAHAMPGMMDSPVAHVRPAAANAADRILAPDGTPLTRKCFWLNATYIANHIL